MATTYSFKIGDIDVKYSDSNTVKIADTEYLLSLLSLRYFKKMFQPGFIEAKLQIRQNAESAMKAPELTSLVNFFKTGNNNVTLSKTVDTKEVVIAQSYYVNRVIPEYKRSEKGQYVQVMLHIYSPDHKLTLDKYCRAYTNRKLAKDILSGNFNETDSILKKAGFKSESVDINHLKFLNYIYSNNDNKIEYKEFLQPYLVQYNESFYDFMARTANRCGEYFYYEGGVLFLGVNNFSAEPTPSNSRKNWVDIDRDTVLSYRYSMAQEELIKVFSQYHDSLEADKQNSSSDYTFSNELPLDEYLGNVMVKDSYTSTLKEFFPKLWGTIPDALGALTTGGIPGIVAWAVPVLAMGTLFAESVAGTKNKKFNDKWLGEKSTAPSNNPINYPDRFDDSKKTSTLFGTQLANSVKSLNYEYNQNLDATLYGFIGNGSKNVSENLIDISIPVEHTSFLLGQDVTFESKSEVANKEKSMKEGEAFNFKHYTVIEVSEVIKAESSNQTKEEWQLGQKVVIAPLYAISVSKYGENAKKDIEIACPPVMCPLIKTSGTQRAIITNGVDPLGYGRVQITYPWQSSTSDSSPFIRQAVPYVPNTDKFGGGFYFQLEANTEVLVDYENGNIERPYVIGCLYSKKAKAPRDGYTYSGGWSPSLHPDEPKEPLVISSKKGHKIKFDDNGNLEDFLMGAVPAIDLTSMLWKHVIPSEARLDQGGESELSGSMSMCDKWGIYKITCNTTKRSISIDSPFGDVQLNAFTGITINCPNGDITLKGKNIKLEAGNEITINSGLNINPPGHSLLRDTILKGAANAILDKFALPMVDFRLLRTVVEMFLKPVTGTLNLKSNRYLLLGAGLGKPEIPASGYSAKGVHMKVYHDERSRLHRQLSYMNTTIDSFFSNFMTKYKDSRTWTNRLVEALKDGDKAKQRKDFVEAAYTKKEYQEADFEFNDGVSADHKNGAIVDAKQAAKAIQNLLKTSEDTFVNVTSLRFGLDSWTKPGTFKKILANEGKKVIPELVQNVIDKKELFDKPDEALLDMNIQKKSIKRYLMYQIIVGTYGVEYVPHNPVEPVSFASVDDFADDSKWAEWVNDIHKYSGKSITPGPLNKQEFSWKEIHWWGLAKLHNAKERVKGPIDRFGLEILDESMKKMHSYNPLVPFQEKDIWGPGKKGEILISDKGGQDTINIVNGALNRTENSDGYTNKIKALLSTIY